MSSETSTAKQENQPDSSVDTVVAVTTDTAVKGAPTPPKKLDLNESEQGESGSGSNETQTIDASSTAGDESSQPNDTTAVGKTVEFKSESKHVEAGTQIPHHHFLQRFLIYNDESYDYEPWDPTSYVRPPPVKGDPDYFFYVDHRYRSEAGEPMIYLSTWSQTLRQFFQSFIGSPFFNDAPEYKLEDFFPVLKEMREKYTAAQSALSPESSLAGTERIDFVKSLGHPNINTETPESELLEFIAQLVEHLEVLLGYLDEQFKPTADRLSLAISHGYIEYDLLQFFIEEEQILWTLDEHGLPIAFEVTDREYINRGLGANYFLVSGDGHFWNGYSYDIYEVERKIYYFEGGRLLTDLPCHHMTDEVRKTLQARGERYVALSGVHHKTYEGSRIMVDKIAYDEEGGYISTPNKEIPEIDSRHLERLPSTVCGFNLASKRWARFLVDKIEPVTFDDGAWDHLVLDQDVKTLIKGLVEVTKNENSSAKIINDVISGKGGGLIAVLHGPPGTGKTLTAEAVAENLQRPLYMVGASELSTMPSTLESNLKSILQLATAWDAVLLIDEADVFLEQRSLHEIERNSLVSVALRVLEYHRGVLFLTTNRITTFDEAFLSRFSIAIRYPELDNEGRLTIWCKFFQLAGYQVENLSDIDCDGAVRPDNVLSGKEIEELAVKPFNGRTIKNLVRTAQALALSLKVPLSIEHVKIVVRAQEKFLREFASIKGEKLGN